MLLLEQLMLQETFRRAMASAIGELFGFVLKPWVESLHLKLNPDHRRYEV